MPKLSGRRGKVSSKTKSEYARNWDDYFANKTIASQKVNEISITEWQNLFAEIIEDGNLAEKEFGQVIIILNHIIKHCIANGFLLNNPIQTALSSYLSL